MGIGSGGRGGTTSGGRTGGGGGAGDGRRGGRNDDGCGSWREGGVGEGVEGVEGEQQMPRPRPPGPTMMESPVLVEKLQYRLWPSLVGTSRS